MNSEKSPSSNNSNDLQYRYIQNLFFEIIDSIRYAKKFYEEQYKHLERPIKTKTTEQIKKIAFHATAYFIKELQNNSKSYSNNKKRIEKLKTTAIEQAIQKVEDG